MAHTEGWTVGMPIIAVISSDYGSREARVYESVITKVGRRWITFQHSSGYGVNRFDAETLAIDGEGYTSPGRIWPTMREYEESLEANIAWSNLRRSLGFTPPNGLTAERIREIAAELGVPQ